MINDYNIRHDEKSYENKKETAGRNSYSNEQCIVFLINFYHQI